MYDDARCKATAYALVQSKSGRNTEIWKWHKRKIVLIQEKLSHEVKKWHSGVNKFYHSLPGLKLLLIPDQIRLGAES